MERSAGENSSVGEEWWCSAGGMGEGVGVGGGGWRWRKGGAGGMEEMVVEGGDGRGGGGIEEGDGRGGSGGMEEGDGRGGGVGLGGGGGRGAGEAGHKRLETRQIARHEGPVIVSRGIRGALCVASIMLPTQAVTRARALST